MILKIGKKEVTVKDKLKVGDFRKLGKIPTEKDLEDIDYLCKLLEVAGVENIDDYNLEDLLLSIMDPKMKAWLGTFVIDPKKVKQIQNTP